MRPCPRSCLLRHKPIPAPLTFSSRRRAYGTDVGQGRDVFSHPNEAIFLASASSISSVPTLDGLPEVVVTGRANVGKSTLLNAVLGRTSLVRTSKKAGRTRALNFFRVGPEPGQIVLVDAPGYGSRGRPEWGRIWEHYVDTRKTLRQICLLINAQHGLTDFDMTMLSSLSQKLSVRSPSSSSSSAPAPVPSFQPILTKIDLLKGDSDAQALAVRSIVMQVKKLAPMSESPILCSLSPKLQVGVEGVREAMSKACR